MQVDDNDPSSLSDSMDFVPPPSHLSPPQPHRVPLSHRRRHIVEALAQRSTQISSSDTSEPSSDQFLPSQSLLHSSPFSGTRDVPFTYRRRSRLGKEAQKTSVKSTTSQSLQSIHSHHKRDREEQDGAPAAMVGTSMEALPSTSAQEEKDELAVNDLPPVEWTARWWTSTPLSQMRRTFRNTKTRASSGDAMAEGSERPISFSSHSDTPFSLPTGPGTMDVDTNLSGASNIRLDDVRERSGEPESGSKPGDRKLAATPSKSGETTFEEVCEALKESMRRAVDERKLSEDVLQSLRKKLDQLVFLVSGSRDGQKEKMVRLKTVVSGALLEKVRMEMVNKMTETTQHCFESLEDVKSALINQILADEEQVQLELEKMDVEINGLAQPLQMLQALTSGAGMVVPSPSASLTGSPTVHGVKNVPSNTMDVSVGNSSGIGMPISSPSTGVTALPTVTSMPTVHIPAFQHLITMSNGSQAVAGSPTGPTHLNGFESSSHGLNEASGNPTVHLQPSPSSSPTKLPRSDEPGAMLLMPGALGLPMLDNPSSILPASHVSLSALTVPLPPPIAPPSSSSQTSTPAVTPQATSKIEPPSFTF